MCRIFLTTIFIFGLILAAPKSITQANTDNIGLVKIEKGGTDAVPQKMNVQGFLADNNGNPVNGTLNDVHFSIWDQQSGGNNIWSSGAQQLVVENGLFRHTLACSSRVFESAAPRWLQIYIGGDFPRIEITSVGFAFQSVKSDTASYSVNSGMWSGHNYGDLYPNANATQLQGRGILNATPGINQVLKWTGSEWIPRDDSIGTGFPGYGTSSTDVSSSSSAGSSSTVARSDHTHRGVRSITAGTGITVSGNPDVTVAFNTSYTVPNSSNSDKLDNYHYNELPYSSQNHNHDATYVNVGESNSITSEMIGSEEVEFSDLDDPLNVSSTWNINGTSVPLIEANNTASTGDVLWANSSSSTSGTWTIYANAYGGLPLYVRKRTDDNAYAVYVDAAGSGSSAEGIYTDGRLVADGGKSTVVRTSKGKEVLFCLESPEEEFYSNGTAQLNNGIATVYFDRLFTEAISQSVPVKVLITSVNSWSGIYVENATANGFTARCGAGDQYAKFNWIAIGRRKGSETRPIVPIPSDEEIARMREKEERIKEMR